MAKPKQRTIMYEGEEYYNIQAAASFCDLSDTGLYARIQRFNKNHSDSPIKKYEFGGREKFIKKADLDRLTRPTPVD